MKKLIFPIVAIYLAVILENSFLNYFLIHGRSLDLVLITFLFIFLLRHWSNNQLLIIGIWTGFMLDVFRYPGFGIGLTAILILITLYQISRHWITSPKKISGFILWFLIYNLVFYASISLLGYFGSLVFHYPSIVSTVTSGGLGIQILFNGIIASLIFLSRQQSKKIFLK